MIIRTSWPARPDSPSPCATQDATEEAKELRARFLADFGRVLGAGHPDAVQLREGQRINRDLEPQQF